MNADRNSVYLLTFYTVTCHGLINGVTVATLKRPLHGAAGGRIE